MSHAYFHRDGDLLTPDRTARGPWNPDQQSGLAIAGLLTRAIEAAPAPAPMRVARLTIDFLGAVLMRPTEVQTRIVRDGKRQQVVETSLWVEGAMAATATGLRIAEIDAPAVTPPKLDYPGPEDAPRTPITRYFDVGHPLETRMIQRSTGDGVPGVFWARFNTAFVAGEVASPVIRACMTADLAGGPSTTPAVREWRYPNADLSLYFAREPQGPWQLAIATMDVGPHGVALVRSTLADEAGVFGFSRQALVLSRPKPTA